MVQQFILGDKLMLKSVKFYVFTKKVRVYIQEANLKNLYGLTLYSLVIMIYTDMLDENATFDK